MTNETDTLKEGSKLLSKDAVLNIARGAALVEGGHSYLPQTPDQVAKFQPHEWVLLAIQSAYVLGLAAGKAVHETTN